MGRNMDPTYPDPVQEKVPHVCGPGGNEVGNRIDQKSEGITIGSGATLSANREQARIVSRGIREDKDP
jgi:hypothetical protein